MEYKHILYGKNGAVATIMLNRPEKLNVMAFQTDQEIDLALTQAEEDDDVKVIIFKGAGRAFCAGGDLADLGHRYCDWQDPKAGEKARRASQRARLQKDGFSFAKLHNHVLLCSKITIVQAHGFCIGGGMMIAEKCDLIIGSEDCQFGYPDERLGTGGFTISPLLILRVGFTIAMGLQISGKRIDGKKAEQIHLINKAVPADKLEAEVNELAQAICLYNKDGIAIAKAHRRQLYESWGLTQWGHIFTMSHVIMTNMRMEPDEFNFMKVRRDKGVKQIGVNYTERFGTLDKLIP